MYILKCHTFHLVGKRESFSFTALLCYWIALTWDDKPEDDPELLLGLCQWSSKGLWWYLHWWFPLREKHCFPPLNTYPEYWQRVSVVFEFKLGVVVSSKWISIFRTLLAPFSEARQNVGKRLCPCYYFFTFSFPFLPTSRVEKHLFTIDKNLTQTVSFGGWPVRRFPMVHSVNCLIENWGGHLHNKSLEIVASSTINSTSWITYSSHFFVSLFCTK